MKCPLLHGNIQKETYRKKHTERQKKYVMISGGFMIPAAQNNSLNDSI